ncbi:MAG: membrane-associated sensor domain-containing protein [Pantoea sp.]|uniref:GGDEF domain-containing protein n=1 Tax=Pantoea sp. TaxID=69393 RepID=UPI00238CF4C4|nr:GGDEF domain-containing protein [Pantoea sp.]MDE1187829.1 membrane-associated sensor domain-containing protein [Pantoea sp.]
MQQNKRERRENAVSLKAWRSRRDMVNHAMGNSISWFIFVNISFALMIYFRNVLFDNFDLSIHATTEIAAIIDGVMLGIVLGSLSLVFVTLKLPAGYIPLKLTVLFFISLMWSYSGYHLIVWWSLSFAWPLTVILMLTALSALYYHLPSLLTFLIPLWTMALISSITLNQGLSIRFLVIWLILTAILIYGRQILLRWFNEAWFRYQQNQTLVAHLDVIAHQDPLTGTANRRAMENYLEKASLHEQPYALIMLDVDYFKRYNDHYGHQSGDTCLSTVAEIIRASVRTPEDFVARYGGEEFLIVLPAAAIDEAIQVADRIRSNIAESSLPHVASEISNRITVSMGIAQNSGSRQPAEIIARADEALYQAKQQGRNRWVIVNRLN